ncbi:MAG: LytTR family DNA-binding domain-containing protein [Lacibacter sp.]
MNVVIIEDEKLVSDDLVEIMQSIDSKITVTKTISTVKEGIQYFQSNLNTHLIFSDIQLGDGYSFEIFKEVQTTTPVVYCTAFDQHALQAFNNNGIAYILKPYSRQSISQAINKYKMLKQPENENQQINYDLLMSAINNSVKNQTLLVNSKNKIIPIKISDVVYFSIEHKNTLLTTFQNQKYFINQSLDELELLCGNAFYRANRQFLVNKAGIQEVQHYGLRKLFVKMTIDTGDDIIVNKVKATDFLNWLKE